MLKTPLDEYLGIALYDMWVYPTGTYGRAQKGKSAIWQLKHRFVGMFVGCHGIPWHPNEVGISLSKCTIKDTFMNIHTEGLSQDANHW